MARLMDLGMSTVNETLIEMGELAERTLQIALDSYFKNYGSRKKVLELSEELRGLADEISDISVELVARYQPVAKDLRLIRVSMEMAYIFWRFSRYSYDIIDTIEILNPVLDGDCDKTPVTEISYLVRNVMDLSLLSLRNKDETIVEKIYELDSIVDALYRKYLRDTINSEDRDIWSIHSRCYISNILILKYLERISDHACFLGDSISYLVTGRSSPRQ